MSIDLTADTGVPITPETSRIDLRDRVAAAAATIDLLVDHGLDFDPTDEDLEVANQLAASFAADPIDTSKQVTSARAAQLSPATLLITKQILDQYGHAVVEHAVHVRHLVTNKLIIETENPDPRIRIRALELLGKITDVGLFTERSEVLVTHQSTDDLKKKLKEKLLQARAAVSPGAKEAFNTLDSSDVRELQAELGI